MIYRAAAGHPAHDRDAVLPHVFRVDLSPCVLVAAYDNGVVVLPENEPVAVSLVFENILFKG